MNSTRRMARAVGVLALISLGLGASGTLPRVHAGGNGRPHITATLLAHDVSHCKKQGAVESCYTTTETSIDVTGAGFTPGGSVKIRIQDAQTFAIYDDQIVVADARGSFSVDTGHRYCTGDGRLVRAYDLNLHSHAPTISIQPCGTL